MQQRLRLRRAADFQRLRLHGATYRRHAIIMSVHPNACGHNRYGIIASRRLGKAVVRNRIRRQIRAGLQHLHPALQPGHDIVVITRQSVLNLAYAQILDSLESLAKEAGIYKDEA
ncbi:MAG: ribonuclease P protein component [Anaerolineales bacterium]